MSTRWYPLYQRGNPQLRVFLPNFWMKLVRPTHEQPPNVVQFACSMQMTKHDIWNYLQKIYKIDIVDVRTTIQTGTSKQTPGKGYVVKEDDTKMAFVVLPKNEVFQFPDIFPQDEEKEHEEEMKTLEVAKDGHREFLNRTSSRPGTPGWFSF